MGGIVSPPMAATLRQFFAKITRTASHTEHVDPNVGVQEAEE